MFGLSAEHVLVLAVLLLILGPRHIPEFGRAVGKSLRNFKDQWDGIVHPSYTQVNPPNPEKSRPQKRSTEKGPVVDV